VVQQPTSTPRERSIGRREAAADVNALAAPWFGSRQAAWSLSVACFRAPRCAMSAIVPISTYSSRIFTTVVPTLLRPGRRPFVVPVPVV